MPNAIINDYIAGALGGMAGLVVGHPFDTTKVQMQTQQASMPYKNTMDAMKNISHQGLSRGFFRGLAFPLISYGAINSVFFGVYGNTLKYLQSAEDGYHPATYGQVFAAGCVGGAAQLCIACPVDVVKIVLQSQIPHGDVNATKEKYFRGPSDCIRHMLRTRGVTSLYRGLTAMTVRDIPGYGIYLLVYEVLYRRIMSANWSDHEGIAAALIGGGVAGVIGWLSVMPFDVAKSQIQADFDCKRHTTFRACIVGIARRGGVPALFRGGVINSIRAVPVNAVIFLVYSQSLRHLNERENKRKATELEQNDLEPD